MRRPRRAGAAAPLLAAGLAAALAACAQTGDFGRAPRTAWNALVAETGSVAAGLRDDPVSRFALTDDEGELRDRAWRFLMPAHERSVFRALAANMTRARALPAAWHPSDPEAYFDALAGGPARSPVPRYRRLAEDAVADGRLLPPFAALAVRVAAADAVRLRSLPFIETLDDGDVREAATRVAENRCLVAWVRHEAEARAASYRFALQHLLIETPGAEAVAAERALAFLEARRTALDDLLPAGAGPRCGFPASERGGALLAQDPPPLAGGGRLVTKD